MDKVQLRRYTKNIGKEIPGEKTPFNEFFYDIIQDWLKDFELKFIHMVRNPFDVMASHKYRPHRKYRVGIPHMSSYSKNWQRSVSLGLARAYSNPEGYYLLKYEDLVTDPISTTSKLCAFLGVDFEKERMLNLSDFEGHIDNTSFPQAVGEGHADFGAIRRPESRKHYLTASEVRIVGSICGELAQALGYSDDDFRSFPPERPGLGITRKLRRVARNYISRLSRARNN